MKKTLHIIPHSHWDREWYLPFEKHRVRLVELFDRLIEVMEQNEDYTYYHMDGQYIVIEDYLEIRPQMRDRLLALVRAGRIQVGPWYILQDEYLTSGEANVRNMLYGIKLCREIGAEPVKTGYFPDAFGNISQAPQIVRGFGFDNAVFGRGINDVGADNKIVKENGITKSEILWRSPDGSEVMGVMFAGWYSNAALTNAYTFDVMPAEDITLYAKWTPLSYKVTFHVNGGVAVPQGSFHVETAYILPGTTRAGYTFEGWYDNAELEGEAVTELPEGSTGDRHFYAKWSDPIVYRITFHTDGGREIAPFEYTILDSSDHDISGKDMVSSKNGYVFVGWYYEENCSGSRN